jgi:hypothetical protein
MERIDESRMSFSSDGDGSDSELSPASEARPPQDWNHHPRSGTIPGGQFELPVATPSSTTTTPLHAPALRERALSATDALFQSNRKRASSESDKTKPVKEGGTTGEGGGGGIRRTLFSRPSKIMTGLAGGGKDKERNNNSNKQQQQQQLQQPVEKDESPISPTYFRPFASPSYLRPRHSHDETHRNFSLNTLSLTSSSVVSTPVETFSHGLLSPGLPPSSTTSSLRPQLFHRSRERKDSNPSSVLSVSTALSKHNSSESNLSHSPASPSLFPLQSSMPKSITTQEIRQVSAAHYCGDATVMDDPWPLLRTRGLGLFHGEGMRINVEELNKNVL